MKYLLAVLFLSMALTACNSNSTESTKTEDKTNDASSVSDSSTSNALATDQSNVTTSQVVNFTGPNDLTIELKTSDNFETAEMTDNSDKTYHLKRAVSGSGVRLANDEGVSIHFKGSEGSVELVPGKSIEIKELKAN
ncbi:hypothetical protein [Acinetobacter stercoris]|uniref:Lysozyme inhibitor n=1 Tax=Acinetobacter stercoris TaxID=2126983 RepID=A0A2U3N4V1_9GAMM|nr:hypothetical protein [Acinetobacter stercoris]SPL72605.1 hypothetical protein KPC_3783 [Acinetobacter stercoris]